MLIDITFLPLQSDSMFTELKPFNTEFVSDTAVFEVTEIGGLIKVSPVCDLGDKHIVFRHDNVSIDIVESSNNKPKVTIYVYESSHVDVSLYNLTGQPVADICSEYLETGIYEYELNYYNLSTGFYFLYMNAKNSNKTYKILFK